MEAKELRQFSVDELNGRIKQWKDEFFRARFKGQTNETPNTSVFRTLRRSIARAKTILNEKQRLGETASAPVAASASQTVEDKPAKAKTKSVKVPKEEKAPKKSASKKAKGE